MSVLGEPQSRMNFREWSSENGPSLARKMSFADMEEKINQNNRSGPCKQIEPNEINI